ncbi:MAG: hypothetical protein QM785_09770 [Pyrinomonadaceae bacterium]
MKFLFFFVFASAHVLSVTTLTAVAQEVPTVDQQIKAVEEENAKLKKLKALLDENKRLKVETGLVTADTSNLQPNNLKSNGSDSSPTVPKVRLQAEASVIGKASTVVRVHSAAMIPPPIGNYVFEVQNKGVSKTFERKIKPDEKNEKIKDWQDESIDLSEGTNKIRVYPKVGGEKIEKSADQIEIECTDCQNFTTSSSTRAIVGIEQVGASSANSKGSPFLDFYFDTPFSIPFGRRKFEFSTWANLRLSSIPVQTFANLGNFGTFPTFLSENSTKSNDLAQSFDFLVGLQTKIPGISGKWGQGFLPGKSSIFLIASAGAINPLSSDKSAQIFKIPTVVSMGMTVVDPNFLNIFPEAAGKTNIAFVSPDRDKFFRQYYAGIRMKTEFQNDSEGNRVFPAMVDFSVGQNEAITGTLRGVILRADGSTPLPVFGGRLTIFGSTQLRLGRRVKETFPLFLNPADSAATLTATSTAIVPIDRYPRTISGRDIFKLGIGVDLFRIFKQTKP